MKKKISKYEIIEKIGVGGFGEVFKARDPYIKRFVAIKTCTSDDQDTRKRFFHEAEIAGRLNHRNITTVYDFGLEDSLPYLIQEYLTGEDLDRKIKRGEEIPFPEKLHYLIQIARGLAYAHRQGVIHRDMKPANIRVLEDGTVKIMDFGIAKLAQQETGLTKTGMTVGTAAYLAPEQIRGEAVDHRTDIFSFGVLAYELLAFERPFQGEQISAVIYQILNREPKPITDVWPAAPADIVEVIERCLAKDADDRFGDGKELQRNLEAIQKAGQAATATMAAGAGLATREIPRPGPSPGMPSPQPPPTRPDAPKPKATEAPASETQTSEAPPAPAPERDDSRLQSLDDLELSSVNLDEVRSRPVPVQGAAAARPGRGRWIALAVLALLALAAGWWLGDADRREQLLGLVAGETPEAVEETADAGAEIEEPPPEVAPPPAEVAPPPAEVAPPPPEVAPPPPPPPPPPDPGRLVVAQVPWTDALSVRVGQARYALTNDRTFTLEPGTYQVVFELDEPGYQVRRTVSVEISEGGRTRLESPIPQPGALSVRASPGRAQARIQVGEEDLGTSPIVGRKLAPGEYTVRMLPVAGANGGLERQVPITSGQEIILTFNLEAGTVHDAVQPLDG